MPDQKPRVSSVRIERLYNLGNYEHVKWSIGIDVPEGSDTLKAVKSLHRLVHALRPLKKPSGYSYAKALIDRPASELRAMIKDGRTSKEDVAAKKALLKEHEENRKYREKMMKIFNDLGGSSTYTDAKDKWEDDEYDY